MWLSLGRGPAALIVAVIIILFNHNYVQMWDWESFVAMVESGHWLWLPRIEALPT